MQQFLDVMYIYCAMPIISHALQYQIKNLCYVYIGMKFRGF